MLKFDHKVRSFIAENNFHKSTCSDFTHKESVHETTLEKYSVFETCITVVMAWFIIKVNLTWHITDGCVIQFKKF